MANSASSQPQPRSTGWLVVHATTTTPWRRLTTVGPFPPKHGLAEPTGRGGQRRLTIGLLEVPTTTDRRSADEAAEDALVDLGRALLLTGEGTDDDKSTGDGGYRPLQHGQLPLG